MKQQHGTVIHIVFHVYEEEGHLNRERKIVDLSQQLPRVGKWRDFLTNCKNKCHLTLLLAVFFYPRVKTWKKTYVLLKETITINQQSRNPIMLWKF